MIYLLKLRNPDRPLRWDENTVCCLLILSSVFLFYSRDDAALCLPPSTPPQRPCRLLFRPCEASASVSSCVSVIKRPRPGGPVVLYWASSWINRGMNGLWMCQHRQPPMVSGGAPYVIAAGVSLFSLMQNLCHLTAVCYFTPFFFFLGTSWFKQGSRFSWNKHAWLL